MNYKRIQPFPSPDHFVDPELSALTAVWLERKGIMEQNGAYKEFIKKLQREWAIETGIIERLYTWDRGVTEVLIQQGIESSIIAHRGGIPQGQAEHIQALINDHLDIVEGLFDVIKGEAPLTEHFIRGLQAQFTDHQDHVDAITEAGVRVRVALEKGKYKSLPNNPRRPDGETHFYCPPELTSEEMESLIRMYRESEAVYPPEVKSAWLHHRFTQIHPFQDGNGRVARALSSLVFLRAGLFPLVIRDSDREAYIGALETADSGNLGPLVGLFSRCQRDAILKALGLEQLAQQSKHADQILASALDLLRDRFSRQQKNVSAVYDYADKLFEYAEHTLQDLAAKLDSELKALDPSNVSIYQARYNSADNSSNRRHYFQKQIVSIAKRFEYFANFESLRAWTRLTICTEQEFNYVVSFHGYGPGNTGVLVVSAFTYIKATSEEDRIEAVELQPATTELFQFNYAESFTTINERFEEWLQTSVTICLAEWKRSLNAGS
jgi:Fic family protein